MPNYTVAMSVSVHFSADDLEALQGIAERTVLKSMAGLLTGADGAFWRVRLDRGRHTMGFLIPQIDAPERGPALIDALAWCAMVSSSFAYFDRRRMFADWCAAWKVERSERSRGFYRESAKTDRKLRRFLGEAEYANLRALGHVPRSKYAEASLHRNM